jgi:DNA replication and repair protein RecF
VFLSHLELSDFRNYHRLAIDIPPAGMLLYGANGSGKTNVLEAVYLLCVGRSQRGAVRTSMIRHGADACHAEGTFSSETAPMASGSAGIGFSRDKKTVLMRNGATVSSQREWFGGREAVSFGPADLALVRGEPAERRRYLDVLICQFSPEYLDALSRYQQALAHRNRLLAREPVDALIQVYEDIMASNGAILCEKRAETSKTLAHSFSRIYADICGGSEPAGLDFLPSVRVETGGENEWKNVFFSLLSNRRDSDRILGFSSRGPHRDELGISIAGHPAKQYASQGQCRSIALALRLASAEVLHEQTRRSMLFLVDDAFAELDKQRMAHIYAHICAHGQVFLTSPLETLPIAVDLPRYAVGDGTLRTL